jgi:hypothetical protein
VPDRHLEAVPASYRMTMILMSKTPRAPPQSANFPSAGNSYAEDLAQQREHQDWF